MTESLIFSDMLKDLPVSSDTSGKSLLITDSQGGLSKAGVDNFRCSDIGLAEPLNTVLTLRQYIERYISPKKIGEMVGVNRYELATMYYVQLTENVKINIQYYHALITKKFGSMSGNYCIISFILFPSHFESSEIYSVSYYTSTNPNAPTISVKKVSMSNVQ